MSQISSKLIVAYWSIVFYKYFLPNIVAVSSYIVCNYRKINVFILYRIGEESTFLGRTQISIISFKFLPNWNKLLQKSSVNELQVPCNYRKVSKYVERRESTEAKLNRNTRVNSFTALIKSKTPQTN